MIRINLLPPEIYQARFRKKIESILVVFGVIIVLIPLGIFGALKKKEAGLGVEIQKVNGDIQKYQQIADQVEILKQKKAELENKQRIMKQLMSGTLIYPHFFEDFMALLPSDVWVGSISTTLDSNGSLAVRTTAQALSPFSVADWLTNLQSSPLCGGIKMGAISAQEAKEGGRPGTVSFTMDFSYSRRDS